MSGESLEDSLFPDIVVLAEDLKPNDLMELIEEQYMLIDRLYSRYSGTLEQYSPKIAQLEKSVKFDNYMGDRN